MASTASDNDIGKIVAYVRTQTKAPIWLVGTSQGSTAAANGAAHLGGKIAGLVLTSSVTRPNRSGETVFDSEPGLIAIGGAAVGVRLE